MPPTHVELNVEAVALDWKGNPIVVLREKDGHRAVFIWVGIAEATAISMEMEGQTAPRPMTHDLLVSVLREVDVSVERVIITDVRTNTYYAELVLSDGEDTRTLDCRPS
ncbi:MAG: bifunctional nuclease family protein, partial [Armatimonadetes bacterium]|nr:bifunctional nuclease family protein [Armatimonadota bacterium]